MYDWELTEPLAKTLQKVANKDPRLYSAVRKKVVEIINSDHPHHYKNLRNVKKEYKRVKIGSSFVLTFKVIENEKLIIFEDLQHHKHIYKR